MHPDADLVGVVDVPVDDRGLVHHEPLEVLVGAPSEGVTGIVSVEPTKALQSLDLYDVLDQTRILVVLVDQHTQTYVCAVLDEGDLSLPRERLCRGIATGGSRDLDRVALLAPVVEFPNQAREDQVLLVRGDNLVRPQLWDKIRDLCHDHMVSTKCHDWLLS